MITLDIVKEYHKLTLSEINKFIVDNNSRQKFVLTRLKEVPDVAARMVLQLENFRREYIGSKETINKVPVTEDNYMQLYLDLKRIRTNLKVHRRLLKLD